MQNRPVEILLVEPDAELTNMIEECMREAMTVSLTTVADAAGALREELTAHHDVLVISNDLPDAAWFDLVSEIRLTNRCPVLVLADTPSMDDMMNALHVGATDVLLKPFDLAHMCTIVEQAGHRAFARQRTRTRYRRLRRISSKIIRERRDLRQRIDLICRDFVHAYRRLAQRVTDTELLSHK